MRLDELDALAEGEFAALNHETVERQAALETPDDVAKHVWILLQRVRIERRHHAAAAKAPDADHHVADAQFAAWPFALGEAFHAADDDVRTQPPCVAPEGPDRAIGRDEQRKNVESVDVLVAGKRCAWLD